ncbi:MAG TPA: OsmC family peroxiredoxin [Terriglobales bacterium]|nr:OsmC family peroxiredoxin [Terriglobales bacterium]
MIRSATATWTGSPITGEGLITTTSGIMNKALYSFGSSTGNDPCTSPSEMLAAAVASCMSLMLVNELSKLHIKHGDVKTESTLKVEEKKGHWEIASIELNVTTTLPDGDEDKLHRAVKAAKSKCPISRALNVPISMTANVAREHSPATV